MPKKRTAEANERAGNPGKRKKHVVAPVAVLPLLDVMPQTELSDDARAVWALLAPDLIALKILRKTDALVFSVFCEAFARYARALIALQREGDIQTVKTVSGDKMRRVNPRTRILKDERDVVLKYAEKFGLTPVDRMRVITHLAGAGATPPDAQPRFPPEPDDDDGDQLDLEDAAAIPDKGPLGYLS